MPVGRAGKVSTHPFAMVVWIVVEKSGGIVEEREKKIAQHSTEMQKKTWQLTRSGNRGRRDTTNKVGGEG